MTAPFQQQFVPDSRYQCFACIRHHLYIHVNTHVCPVLPFSESGSESESLVLRHLCCYFVPIAKTRIQ